MRENASKKKAGKGAATSNELTYVHSARNYIPGLNASNGAHWRTTVARRDQQRRPGPNHIWPSVVTKGCEAKRREGQKRSVCLFVERESNPC